MGFLSLLIVASMPVFQLLIICFVGVILSFKSINILSPNARRDLNKIVFSVFAPALIFGSLAKTITYQEMISWWFMPVNIGITFLIGGSLGWVAVKILRPKPHLEGLIIACCSAGNLGFMLLIIIPAVCAEEGSPFGDHSVCSIRGLCYNALSMALGGFYIWTHTYGLMKKAGAIHEKTRTDEKSLRIPNRDSDIETVLPTSSMKTAIQSEEDQTVVPLLHGEKLGGKMASFWGKLEEIFHQFVEELMAPPTIAAILGFIVGVIPWLKSLIIGGTAPLRVIEDSITLLGNGTIPCNVLVLGANLTKGLRKSTLAPSAILSIIIIKYINFIHNHHQVHRSSKYRDFCRERSKQTRVLATRSIVSICSTSTVCSSTSSSYRHNGRVVRCWATRVFCHFFMDLFNSCSRSYILVNSLHVYLSLDYIM